MKRQGIIQIIFIMILCFGGVVGALWAQEVEIEGTGERILTDERDGKTYRIRLMPDGHYWMVDDLRYGGQPDTCKGKSMFTGCLANQHPGTGYWYNWMVAMQQPLPDASATVLSCAGIKGDGKRCKGICPDGWHIPTKDEFDGLNVRFQELGCRHDSCWNAQSQWEGKLNGAIFPDGTLNGWGETGFYWASTTYGNDSPAFLLITGGLVKTTRGYRMQPVGMAVRCVRNY